MIEIVERGGQWGASDFNLQFKNCTPGKRGGGGDEGGRERENACKHS